METVIGNTDGYAGTANQVSRGVTLFPDRGDFCIGGFFGPVLTSATDMPFGTKKWIVRKKTKRELVLVDLSFSRGNALMAELIRGNHSGDGGI